MANEVVISGVGGFFPDSLNLETFKTLLMANEILTHENESKQWTKTNSFGMVPTVGRTAHKHLEFDHGFFGIHPRLAFWGDPCARMGYEASFEAVIDAGINPSALRGSLTNVYTGISLSQYEPFTMNAFNQADGYGIMGLSRAMCPNRISYFFDFHGHSCAFASSWGWGQQALQLAHDAIRNGECTGALVVSSSLAAFPQLNVHYKKLGLLSDDGLTRCFDAKASGSQASDAVVCMFLQRADLAKRCYARLVFSRCGVADNRLSFDPTVYNPVGIERFLSNAYRENGEDPRHVVYLEADGSGDKIREEAEIQAEAAVLGAGRDAQCPLLIGSVKSNVGNAEASNGLVAVSKLIIAMETEIIPATISHDTPNPHMKALVDGRLKVVTKNVPLKIDEDTMLAATSLGLAGSVAHVVLKPNLKSKKVSNPKDELPFLVPITGRTIEAVEKAVKTVRTAPFDPEYYRLVQDLFATDIRGYPFRSYVICPDPDDAPANVEQFVPREIWFVYSGMGSQWAGMGHNLTRLPIIKETIERLHAVLQAKGVDLISILTEEGDTAFDNILKSFVGITAMQIALTNVLTAIGLKPDGLIGHSVGELGCSFADGCLTEEQTILAAYARGKASNDVELIPGMMAAVGLGYRDILPRLPEGVEVACHNSSTSCTLSGPTALVKAFVRKLTDEGIFARAVNVSNIAYHSQYIQPAAPFLRKYLEEVIPDPKPRSSKWISTSAPQTQWDSPAGRLCSAEYHTNNLLGSVLFEEGIEHIPKMATLIEIAPHGLLQAILKRALPDHVHIPLAQRRAESNLHLLLNAIGKLFSTGIPLQVSALYPEITFPVSRGTPSLAPLVSWKWDTSVSLMTTNITHENLGHTGDVLSSGPTLLAQGKNLYPLSELLMLVWDGLAVKNDLCVAGFPVTFRNVHIVRWVERPAGGATRLAVRYARGSGRFEVVLDDPNIPLEQGIVMWGFMTPLDESSQRLPLPSSVTQEEAVSIEPWEVLDELASRGLTYSSHFRAITTLQQSPSDWKATIQIDGSWSSLFEPMFQLAMLQLMQCSETLRLPTSFQRLDIDPRKITGKKEVPVCLHLATGLLEGDGLYLAGVTLHNYIREDLPPLRKHFVPHGSTDLKNTEEFSAVVAQIALEMALREVLALIILEVKGSSGNLNGLGPAICTALKNYASIQACVGSVDATALGQLADKNACLLLSGRDTVRDAASQISRNGGLLLTRTASRVSLTTDLAIVAEQHLGQEWLTLVKKAEPVPADAHFVELEADECIPANLEASFYKPALIIWRGEPSEGIQFVAEKIRRSKYGKCTRLVFVLDRNAPRMSLCTPDLRSQLRLGLPVNILRGGVWGSWRALPLAKCAPTALAVQCVERVQIQALSLNLPSSEKQFSPGPLDFVGVTLLAGKGCRVMGVARCVSTQSKPQLDPELRWLVPDAWTNQEAATVPYTYSTAFYALQVVARVQEGESILVHQGASPLGQAALRVACHVGCDPIYTTVHSDAERDMLQSNFPKIKQSNVLSCADCSFEWRLRVLTKDHGVDVVVNSLPGDRMHASLRCVNKWGRLLHFGREDMLSANTFGTYMFLKSIALFGFSGDQLLHATERDRSAVVQGVREGLDNGVVQPIIGSKMFRADDWQEALRSLELTECSKAILDVKVSGALGARQCNPRSSYVIIGGSSAHWHQVAGWLSLNGASTIVAAPALRPGLHASQRHRAQSLHRSFGTNVIVQEVPTWNIASVTHVVESATKIAPVDAVFVLLEDASWNSVPVLVNKALSRLRDTSLLMLSSDPVTAGALGSLCEERRRAGLRGACLFGPMHGATDMLARMLGEDAPAVSMLSCRLSTEDTESLSVAGLKEQMPRTASDLAVLGAAVHKVPASKSRLREIGTLGRQARYALEVTPIFVFPPLGVLLPATRLALNALGRKVTSPLVCIEVSPADDIVEQAAVAVKALYTSRPVGPYNLLGWALSAPLTQEVARQLESAGRRVCTFLLDSNLATMASWARRQLDEGLEFPNVDGDGQTLQSPEAQKGLHCIRGFLEAVVKHKPVTAVPVRGKLVLLGLDTTANSSFSILDPNITTSVCPEEEKHLGFTSRWLSGVLNEELAVSKMISEDELRLHLF